MFGYLNPKLFCFEFLCQQKPYLLCISEQNLSKKRACPFLPSEAPFQALGYFERPGCCLKNRAKRFQTIHTNFHFFSWASISTDRQPAQWSCLVIAGLAVKLKTVEIHTIILAVGKCTFAIKRFQFDLLEWRLYFIHNLRGSREKLWSS